MFNFEEPISIEKATNMSPIVLAFIGDAVYSLYVREKNAFTTDYKTGVLNDKTSLKVCAKAQAELADLVVDILSEEELAIYKRARNAKKPSKSKSCSVVEYNKSTGIEAVVGYLYITGQRQRINQLLENIK
ncbi:MAG: Mini-ribonuclease 3 [Clostridia bacterium]|nr:Mini-ribonuclease 3 [Clostridia bacterium]